jgi:nucleoside-diphosphate-sugar epimerase
MMQGMRVAVTGGSGFVGTALCAALVSSGCTVAALSRSDGWELDGVRAVHGDLTNAEALDDLIEGAHVVVHAAGLVRSTNEGALRAVNVEGLAALLDRCGAVERVIHVSTAGVHGLPGGSVDESSPFAPPNPYEASKAAAERLLFQRRPSGATAIRPTNILGIGHPLDPLARFLASTASGRIWTWSGAWSNYVGVDAVAAAVVAAAADPDPPTTLLVNDPRPVAGLAAVAAELLGVRDRTHLLPSVAARAGLPPLAAISRFVAGLHRVRSVLETTRFETQHGAWLHAAGLRVDLEPTLAAMIEDYRGRGLL